MNSRPPSSHAIRLQAARAFRSRQQGLSPSRPMAAPPPAAVDTNVRSTVTMTELPYLQRRVLRIVALHGRLTAQQLYLEADFPARLEADQLTLLGLIDRHVDGQDFAFEITAAGAHCVATEPPRKSAPYHPNGASRYV